jgi:hypothetical protein
MRLAREKHGPSHPAWKKKAVHYSFIVQNNKILEMGMNRPNSGPPIYYGYPRYAEMHSEIDAWGKAKGILEDDMWEIVNIKLTKKVPNFPMADAAPCEWCMLFLVARGCKHFYFTTNSGQIAKIIN